MINDKYQISEKFGRRFPFICIFGTFGGIWWIIMGFYLPLEISMIYLLLMVYGLFINIGLAIADTAIDGLILDVTPKENLGHVQGWTFGMLIFGHMAGGYLIGISFIILSLPIPWLFMMECILMIIVCFTPYFIEEELISSEKVYVWKKVKDIFSKKLRSFHKFLLKFISINAPNLVFTCSIFSPILLKVREMLGISSSRRIFSLSIVKQFDIEWQP